VRGCERLIMSSGPCAWQVLPTTYTEVMKNIEASRRFVAAGRFQVLEKEERFKSIEH
jgi:hypothetical protein